MVRYRPGSHRRRGQHIFFRCAEATRSGTVAAGIDLKADGRYVLVAPSIHLSGVAYEWDGSRGREAILSPTDPPGWLFQHRNGSQHRVRSDDREQWTPGERNTRLTSLSGSMRRQRVSPEAIEAALIIKNRKRCVPPYLMKKSGASLKALVGMSPARFHQWDSGSSNGAASETSTDRSDYQMRSAELRSEGTLPHLAPLPEPDITGT